MVNGSISMGIKPSLPESKESRKKSSSSIGPTTTRAFTPPLLLVVMPQVKELFAVSFRIFNQQI